MKKIAFRRIFLPSGRATFLDDIRLSFSMSSISAHPGRPLARRDP